MYQDTCKSHTVKKPKHKMELQESMRAKQVYDKLEKDFIKEGITDEWQDAYFNGIEKYITKNFRERNMGLVCDFTDDITYVFTAVFPSDKVMQEILDKDIKNALLFVHHPATWDIREAPDIFQGMNKDLLEKFKENKISIYNLHTPLDNYSDYSTSVSLAKALGLDIVKPFAKYFGTECGVLCKTDMPTIKQLQDNFRTILGHKIKTYPYGNEIINDGLVAVVAGGGNDKEILEEVKQLGANTFITGITTKNEFSQPAHDFAEEHKINVLGGTHYSTETFACIEMVKYFNKLGLTSEFIDDEPILEDM